MSEHGDLQITRTKSGKRRYFIEIWHPELNKYQVIRGDNGYVVEQKADTIMAQWDEMWERRMAVDQARKIREQRAIDKESKLNLAAEKTQDALDKLEVLDNILLHTLNVNDAVNWETLKNFNDYPDPRPTRPIIDPEPIISDEKYQPKFSLLDIFSQSRRMGKIESTEDTFNKDYQFWKETKEYVEAEHARLVIEWEESRAEYLRERDENNSSINAKRDAFFQGEEEAILDYFDIVLARSEYPDYFPQSYELDFSSEGRHLIIDYQLPDVSVIPTLKEVKYIQSRDEFKESHIPKSQLNRIFDNLLYQIALRTIHEVFEADTTNVLSNVIFNGYVESIDPATGQQKIACILSVQANQIEFETINLDKIDPKACFKNLKGISSTNLHSLTPIAPILSIDREDKRFIDSYAVVADLGEEDNLAAMDWEDFEHLVREIFEKEFASSGGEVRVTQASRDGGIDAIAFDPDPIRGGKIVIQAKRYTNTVGVSAVRDLYGSVINEGAAKGILVTTSNYGPDAYEFAKGKPITLLNGNNLLHLLEKHGHKAKIDIQEAKRKLYGNL